MEIADKYATISIKEERSSFYLKRNAMFQHSMENITIPSLIIKEINGKEKSFISVGNEQKSPTLFYRFKETDCDACIQSALNLLKEISLQLPKNIIILSGYTNSRQFAAFAKSQNQQLQVYNVEKLPWKVDDIEEPYFFVVTEGKYINNVFIPSKEDNKYTENYIHTLIHKYWNHNHECKTDN